MTSCSNCCGDFTRPDRTSASTPTGLGYNQPVPDTHKVEPDPERSCARSSQNRPAQNAKPGGGRGAGDLVSTAADCIGAAEPPDESLPQIPEIQVKNGTRRTKPHEFSELAFAPSAGFQFDGKWGKPGIPGLPNGPPVGPGGGGEPAAGGGASCFLYCAIRPERVSMSRGMRGAEI